MVIAGPAFNAGRYGLACAEVCKQRRRLAASGDRDASVPARSAIRQSYLHCANRSYLRRDADSVSCHGAPSPEAEPW